MSQQTATMPDVLTPEEVAAYLQVSRATVYRLVRDRQLAACRVGRTIRIPHEDFQTFLRMSSTREAVREALFDRLMSHARRHPEIDGDALVDELEEMDEEEKQRARAS